MKKYIFILLIIIVSVSITACGDNAINNQVLNSNNLISEQEQNQELIFDQNMLAVGILNLEATSMAISSEQAENLLPYWKLLETLISSSIAAQEEIDAVLFEISSELSADQLTYISEMDYDPTNLRELMSDMGIELAARREGENNPEGGIVGGGAGPGGGVPGQGRPGAGGVPGLGGPGEGADLSPEDQATREALIEERGGAAGGFNIPLIQAMIIFLESK